jgi:subtilase family serine protease
MDNSVSSSTLVATNETYDKPKDTSLSIVDNYTVTNDRILDSSNAAIQLTNSSANTVKHWYSDKVSLIQCFFALVIIALLSIKRNSNLTELSDQKTSHRQPLYWRPFRDK